MTQKTFFHHQNFADQTEMNKIHQFVKDFYQNAKAKGLFVSKEEVQKIMDDRQSNKYASPKLTSKNSLCYNELNWFYESKTFNKLVSEVKGLLGLDLDMFMARVLITVPVCDIPDYIKEVIFPAEGKKHGSLGAFIKDEFARASFFAYNPWHNDAIDFPDSDCYFLNTLFPLTPRLNGQAPLSFVPESMGLAKMPQPFFPVINGDSFVLDYNGKKFDLKIANPNVGLGDLMMWHAYIIHNVGVNTASEPSFSLRFNFSPSNRKNGIRDLGHIKKISRSWLSDLTESV